MSNSIQQDFKFWSLLKFATPSIIMMVFLSLYTIIDGIFISRFAGSNALSSLNIVYPMYNILLAFGVMISNGGSALVGRKLGEGKDKEARENFTFLAVVSVCISLILLVVVQLFKTLISYALGSNEALLADCNAYLGTLFLFAPFCVLQSLFQMFFITSGKPGLGMALTVIAGIANAVLDYVFLSIFDMGITGAAIATGIGQIISATGGLIFFSQKNKNLYFVPLRADLAALKETCINGSSEMVTNISNGVITYAFNIILMKLAGADGVAAITILLYAQFTFNALYMGFSMGVAPVFSFQYGAKNTPKLKHLYKISLIMVTFSSAIITILAFLLSDTVVGIFVAKGTNPYNLAAKGFPLFAICFLFSGFNIFSSSLFTALSDGKTSALLSFSRTFAFILLSLLILPLFLGLTGVWIAIPVAEVASTIIALLLHRKKLTF